MTSGSTESVVPDMPSAESEQSERLADVMRDDVGAFVGALSLVLRETIIRFEQAASRITDIVQPARASRELIVAFQEFDRLQQEFSALSNVLEHFAENATGTAHKGHEAIEAISIANVKERLIRYLQNPVEDLTPEQAEEVVF